MIIGVMHPLGNTSTATDKPPTPALDGVTRLSDWGLIRADGPDAASFLHGQLTQDMNSLREGEARLAGFCSPKGRLLATLVVWRLGPESIALACSADLLAPTLKRLQMFVMRAKCKLSDASGTLALWGLAGPVATAAALADRPRPQPWQVLGDETTSLLCLPDAAGTSRLMLAQAADAPAPKAAELALSDWQWLEVQSGILRLVAACSEQFVPQMVNLELVGGVNFQKGCFPGQEVVARMQYRGTLKRRAQLFDADTPLQAGMEIFHSADPGQPAGLVALAAPHPTGVGSSALVEVKLAALVDGQLHAGAADGPVLRQRALPYTLPTEAP